MAQILGKIEIYFGKVVDNLDELKQNRCRVAIDGYTNEHSKEDLPWYFQWNGNTYLPEIDDVVPVIVFDENFSTCFYGKKIDRKESELSDEDYVNYVEIFKRTVGGYDVELSYVKSKGITFSNKGTKSILSIDSFSIFCEKNSIVVTKDKINIGNNAKEATILGDKGVKMYEDIIAHQLNTITKLVNLFTGVASVCTTPYTVSIGAYITANLPIITPELTTENSKLKTSTTKLQSKKTFIE